MTIKNQMKESFRYAMESLCEANMRLSEFAVRKQKFFGTGVSLALYFDVLSILMKRPDWGYVGGLVFLTMITPPVGLELLDRAVYNRYLKKNSRFQDCAP